MEGCEAVVVGAVDVGAVQEEVVENEWGDTCAGCVEWCAACGAGEVDGEDG